MSFDDPLKGLFSDGSSPLHTPLSSPSLRNRSVSELSQHSLSIGEPAIKDGTFSDVDLNSDHAGVHPPSEHEIELAALKAEAAEARETAAEAEARVASLEKSLKQAERKADQLSAKVVELSSAQSTPARTTAHEDSAAEIARLQRKAQQQEKALSRLTTLHHNTATAMTTAQKTIDSLQGAVRRLQGADKRAADAESTLKRLQEQHNQLQKEKNQLKAQASSSVESDDRLVRAEQERQRAAQQAHTLRLENDHLRAKITGLEEKLQHAVSISASVSQANRQSPQKRKRGQEQGGSDAVQARSLVPARTSVPTTTNEDFAVQALSRELRDARAREQQYAGEADRLRVVLRQAYTALKAAQESAQESHEPGLQRWAALQKPLLSSVQRSLADTMPATGPEGLMLMPPHASAPSSQRQTSGFQQPAAISSSQSSAPSQRIQQAPSASSSAVLPAFSPPRSPARTIDPVSPPRASPAMLRTQDSSHTVSSRPALPVQASSSKPSAHAENGATKQQQQQQQPESCPPDQAIQAPSTADLQQELRLIQLPNPVLSDPPTMPRRKKSERPLSYLTRVMHFVASRLHQGGDGQAIQKAITALQSYATMEQPVACIAAVLLRSMLGSANAVLQQAARTIAASDATSTVSDEPKDPVHGWMGLLHRLRDSDKSGLRRVFSMLVSVLQARLLSQRMNTPEFASQAFMAARILSVLTSADGPDASIHLLGDALATVSLCTPFVLAGLLYDQVMAKDKSASWSASTLLATTETSGTGDLSTQQRARLILAQALSFAQSVVHGLDTASPTPSGATASGLPELLGQLEALETKYCALKPAAAGATSMDAASDSLSRAQVGALSKAMLSQLQARLGWRKVVPRDGEGSVTSACLHGLLAIGGTSDMIDVPVLPVGTLPAEVRLCPGYWSRWMRVILSSMAEWATNGDSTLNPAAVQLLDISDANEALLPSPAAPSRSELSNHALTWLDLSLALRLLGVALPPTTIHHVLCDGDGSASSSDVDAGLSAIQCPATRFAALRVVASSMLGSTHILQPRALPHIADSYQQIIYQASVVLAASMSTAKAAPTVPLAGQVAAAHCLAGLYHDLLQREPNLAAQHTENLSEWPACRFPANAETQSPDYTITSLCIGTLKGWQKQRKTVSLGFLLRRLCLHGIGLVVLWRAQLDLAILRQLPPVVQLAGSDCGARYWEITTQRYAQSYGRKPASLTRHHEAVQALELSASVQGWLIPPAFHAVHGTPHGGGGGGGGGSGGSKGGSRGKARGGQRRQAGNRGSKRQKTE